MSPTSPKPKPQPQWRETAEQLNGLPGDGPVTLAAIWENGRIATRTFEKHDTDSAILWLQEQDGEPNRYFEVNSSVPGARNRRAKQEDIVLARQCGVDIDRLDAIPDVEAFPLPPSLVIFTGGGYQVFFFLNAPTADVARASRVSERLAKLWGGDHCHSPDHLFRLAGTLNFPNAKKRGRGRTVARAYIVRSLTHFGRAYDLEEIEAALDAAGAPQVGSTDLTGPVTLRSVDDLPKTVPPAIADLIRIGDDPDRPMGGQGAKYLSRSHALFHVVRVLARQKVAKEVIAGILLNPANGISASVLDKPNPVIYARRQAIRAYEVESETWPDVDRGGNPRATYRNARIGLQKMGIVPEFDQFANRKRVNGYPVQSVVSELSDDICARIRAEFLERFGFDARKDHIIDAVHGLRVENPVHPICAYLDKLKWDGVPRISRLLSTYFSAEDTELHRAMAEKVMVAAVRRVREPGAKFDTILVLEGPQGSGKSQAVALLAGAEYHSDQEILAMDPKAQAEALEGVWIFELCELQGLGKADIDKVKAFASRTADRMRPAYARFRETHPRQTIFIGTTNDQQYLRDQTGNRRFWPVKTGKVDLDGLRRDRDQLWAEAAALEAAGASLVLPEALWPMAAEAQAARIVEDPWWDRLGGAKGTLENGVERISTADVLAQLEMLPAQMNSASAKRIVPIMRDHGWEGPKQMRIHGKPVRGYERHRDAPDSPRLDDPIDMPGALRKPDTT